MRTPSVDSRLVGILEKAVQAQKHLREALGEVTSLPEGEARRARELLEPVKNHLDAGVDDFRAWVETPPE